MACLLETQPLEFLLSPSPGPRCIPSILLNPTCKLQTILSGTKQISHWPGRPFPAHLSRFLASLLPPFQRIPTLTRLNIFAARLWQSSQIQDFSLGSASMQSHDLHFHSVAAAHLDWHQGFCACLILTDVLLTSHACLLRWDFLSSSLLLHPLPIPFQWPPSIPWLFSLSRVPVLSHSGPYHTVQTHPRVPLLLLSHQWPLTPDLFSASQAWSYLLDVSIHLPLILFHSTSQSVASYTDLERKITKSTGIRNPINAGIQT